MRWGLSVSALTLWLSSATNSGLTWDHTVLSAWSKRSKEVLHRGEQGPPLVLSSLSLEETGEKPPSWLCKLIFALHCSSNDSDKVFCSTEMCFLYACIYTHTYGFYIHRYPYESCMLPLRKFRRHLHPVSPHTPPMWGMFYNECLCFFLGSRRVLCAFILLCFFHAL